MDSNGETQTEEFGPEMKTEGAEVRQTRFDFLNPNTNYTVDVCAVTRQQKCGRTTTTRHVIFFPAVT